MKKVRYSCIFLCLTMVAILLTGCSSSSGFAAGSLTSIVGKTLTPHTLQKPMITSKPQTSCPAAGTARAAIMPPLTLGKHPVVVYTWNQISTDGRGQNIAATLRRYDTANGRKSDIVTLPKVSITNAQVSTDGLWVLFVTNFSDHTALQLIRVDGKYLQTLYCYNGRHSINVVRWSPDQKTIALEENASSLAKHPIITLNLASGTLQTIVNDYFLTLETWVDHSHFVVSRTAPDPGHPGYPLTFYLADIAYHNVPIQHLPMIWRGQGVCYTVIPANPHVLYLSQCVEWDQITGKRQPSSIQRIPVSGALPAGRPQQILTYDAGDIIQTGLINHQNLLYVTAGSRANDGLWTVSTDSHRTIKHLIVINFAQAHEWVELNSNSTNTWSNVSRNGAMYAVKITGYTYQSLQIGSVAGGTAKVFAQANNNFLDTLQVAGWTTI